MFKTAVLKLFRKAFGPWVQPAPSRPKPRPFVKLVLEWLEKRECPNAGTDTLIWDPQGGSSDPTKAQNYLDQNTGQTATQPPISTNPIVLDGSKSAYNQPIVFQTPTTVASLTVQNGYNSNLLIVPGGSLSTSANDQVQTGCTLNLTSGSTTGILLTNGSSFIVQAGGTANFQDDTPAVSSETFLTAEGDKAGEILNNFGTVSWKGTAVPTGNSRISDYLAAPVLNSGTFNVDGGTGNKPGLVPGQLIITGADPLTNNVSFDQTAGAFNLSNMANVIVKQGYGQSGGSLTSDATPSGGYPDVLQAGYFGTGDISIVGSASQVTVGNVVNNVGTLRLNANTVEIDSTINVSGETLGGSSAACDVLDCGTAAVTLYEHSILNVGTTGTGNLGKNNDWVVMKYGSYTGAWGAQYWPNGMNLQNQATQVELKN